MVTVRKQRSPNAKPKKRKPQSVVDRIQKGVTFEEEGIKLLVYGKSGTGKTRLWGSFPGPTLAVLCSGGKKPGELRSLTASQRKKVNPVSLHHAEELRELIDHAQEGKYKTVVLDHASGLQHLVLCDVLGIDELPEQMGWGVASQQDWGQCSLQSKELFKALLNLDTNVVIVAQERDFGETDSGGDLDLLPTIGAALTPSVTGWLNPACDYVVNTFIRRKTKAKKIKIAGKEKIVKEPTKEIEFCIRTAPDPVYTVKFRVPHDNLPDVIVNPTYTKIMDIIGG